MKNINVSFNGTGEILVSPEPARNTLVERTGAGSEFTGWLDLPVNYDKEEFARIKKAADKIRSNSKALIVCGVGGSYLGAVSAIEFLKGQFANQKALVNGDDLQIYFAGNNLSQIYLNHIIELIKEQDFSVNVISKSGGTMETAVSFRIFRDLLEKKYGKDGAKERIFATTSKDTGALKALADEEGYETFIIPDDIGGRYSVLTAVGLLPIAAAGCDIDQLMAGAADMREELISCNGLENDAIKYAAVRQSLYRSGKAIEIFGTFESDLRNIGEWLKQLFGESEGKEGKGIFPVSVTLTNDLHSMGQMIQEGERNIFETIINIENTENELALPAFEKDFDGFKHLENKSLKIFKECAVEGVAQAHLDGGVPQIRITIPDKGEHSLGALFYFFEFACGVSAYIEGVNPFNQPGVEAYKKNIKKQLEKY